MTRRAQKPTQEYGEEQLEVETYERADSEDPFLAFSDANPSDIYTVERSKPLGATGYLGELPAPDNIHDMPEMIRQAWGGGEFVVKRKGRMHKGKMLWRPGSVRIRIAGEPLDAEGNAYRRREAAITAPPFVVQGSSGDAVQSQLLRMLGDVVAKSLGGKDAAGNPAIDLVGLVQALHSTLQPVAQPAAASEDALGSLERSLNTFARLKKLGLLGGTAKPKDDDDDDDDGGMLGALGFGGGGKSGRMMEMMMMAKLMGVDARALLGGGMPALQPPTPTPAPTFQAPAPNTVYHPQFGWIPYVPPNQTPTVKPLENARVNNVSHAESLNSTDLPETEDESEDSESYLSADELLEEFSGLEKGDKERFLSGLLERMGIPPDVMGKIGDTMNSVATPASPSHPYAYAGAHHSSGDGSDGT